MARTWNIPDPQIERMADGLRKAGLAIEPALGLRDLTRRGLRSLACLIRTYDPSTRPD